MIPHVIMLSILGLWKCSIPESLESETILRDPLKKLDFQHRKFAWFKIFTALKMDDIKKAPCGQAPLCSSESIMSNHVRTSFVLIITVAHQKIWALEIFGFSGVRKWYKNVCKTAIFQAKRLIFCVNTYFLILWTPINSVLWFLKKNLTDTSFEKY